MSGKRLPVHGTARLCDAGDRMHRHRRPSTLILVLGGAASGKSQAALDLAGPIGPKAFVATGQARDSEMCERIRRHRATRTSDWDTAEIPLDLVRWFTRQGSFYRTIVVDCLTLWLSNLLEAGLRDQAVPRKVDQLLGAVRSTSARIVLVSNETGLGIVPSSRAGRRFRDLTGKAHQQIAAGADAVYFIVAGRAVHLK